MEFTIHVHVTGLDKLANGLTALAGKTANPAHLVPSLPAMRGAPGNTAPDPSQAPGGHIHAAAMTAPAPTASVMNPAAAAKGAPVNVAPQMNIAPNPAPVQPAPAPAPTAPAGMRSYTRDEIAQPAAAWCYADPAKTAERSAALTALNTEFGVMGLDQLPPEQYGAYALRLRQLGVAI